MSGQEFASLSGLLELVETIVVDAHRRLHEMEHREWSRPVAYRWLRYEDPMPVERLREGVKRLERSGASFDPMAVDKACEEAEKRGFSI